MGLFNKIKKLSIFSGLFSVDEEFFEELEEALILSDMGMDTTMEAVEELRTQYAESSEKVLGDLRATAPAMEWLTLMNSTSNTPSKPISSNIA